MSHLYFLVTSNAVNKAALSALLLGGWPHRQAGTRCHGRNQLFSADQDRPQGSARCASGPLWKFCLLKEAGDQRRCLRGGALAPDGARRVGLTRGRRHRPCRRGYGRASNTRLNGVSATRRKRVKPAAPTTSPILASPACAPSARPTSCDSEAGVHSSVENP